MNNLGVLTVISGFSGAGKGTVTKALLKQYDNYALSVSATTRKPRPGETEGVHYFFKSTDAFEQMIREGAFIEHARYQGNYYGTPLSYVKSQLAEGKDVILEIEVQGALEVKKKLPDTALIFLTPPSVSELKRRLTGRGTETAEEIGGRLIRAAEEAECMDRYDYIIVNDTVDGCVRDIHAAIQSLHKKPKYCGTLIETIKEELKKQEEDL